MHRAAGESTRRKRAFPWTPTERFPSASTVGGDLGERRRAQRFPGFADTEEDGDSTPPAPTVVTLTRHFADMLGQSVVRTVDEEGPSGQESV
jgi:hypothetical protein